MVEKVIALAVLFCSLAIGFISLLRELNNLSKRYAFISEYLQVFSRFIEKESFDGELYTKLTLDSVKLQRTLGRFGILEYKPAVAMYVIRNYQIINLLPQIRQAKTSQFLYHERHDENAIIFYEGVLRYMGVVEEEQNEIKKQLFNPFLWFREGVRHILLLPLLILNWFGLIGITFINVIRDSAIFKVFSGIAALIAFLGTIIAIGADWEPFKNTVTPLLSPLLSPLLTP